MNYRKFKIFHGAIGELLTIIMLVAVLALMFLPTLAQAQTTNVSYSGGAPVYPIGTLAQRGAGIVISGDVVLKTGNIDYTTNAAAIMAVPQANNVAFGITATSTNASANGVFTVPFDKGTGAGDWTPAFTLTVTLSGTSVVSANTNIVTGGYMFYRVHNATNADASYSATWTAGFSSKNGL